VGFCILVGAGFFSLLLSNRTVTYEYFTQLISRYFVVL